MKSANTKQLLSTCFFTMMSVERRAPIQHLAPTFSSTLVGALTIEGYLWGCLGCVWNPFTLLMAAIVLVKYLFVRRKDQ